MFVRSLLRTTTTTMPSARSMVTRNASTYVPRPEPMGPFRQFFHDKPVPVDAYPLIAIVVVMCSGATYMLTKHIKEDRDHLRWLPKHGGVKFEIPRE
ncbi:hypothetical protein CNBM1930 [Cryptococcus deneoformans B-3501A]|uniref:Expressed protein n=1 Tax=Cryptococcus deneoformans (strain JEC21 / ATCC MYA-565) TaxID=214684 RepID=Q5K7L1_CRYD1|nr:expressed protein [Cryptococcus neoformans var. neoformans JEC21]XP_772035.1 hypothetical protein CNBM1930 [Cryptococcus neoformans var. neoformans B-3501A]AAW46767.1 expressed protein [Cryptococcus neoformans var. neoformans JEC21]EAL17388.1 hypothetical protein CNBM1930 [Cryptococcus neoformans var. neoformans B-3501A]